jgi:tRNA-modifying protein YgfZ
MLLAKTAVLPDRSVIRLGGPDAEKLLQGVITNDMDLLAEQPAIFAALLTPQGKILADFFVSKAGDDFLLETATAQAAELVKRLTLYKLRAKVDIHDVTGEYAVLAAWGKSLTTSGETQGMVSFPDPRLPALGLRALGEARFASDIAAAANEADVSPDDYHAHRIALGVPEGGKDYAFGDTFPHDANFDLIHGVSFTKGCFIGQEVVSRIEHRGAARKRIVILKGDAPLRSGSHIEAGAAVMGTIGSVAGTRGLGLVRLDRAEEARAKGQALTADGTKLVISLPHYMRQTVPTAAP